MVRRNAELIVFAVNQAREAEATGKSERFILPILMQSGLEIPATLVAAKPKCPDLLSVRVIRCAVKIRSGSPSQHLAISNPPLFVTPSPRGCLRRGSQWRASRW